MTFITNMHGLFLWKIKRVLQLPMLFRKLSKNLIASQIENGMIKAANFTIDQWNHD